MFRVRLPGTGEKRAGPGMTAETTAGSVAEPELRHITVFFCDLVGSTPLAQMVDPEDYHELIQDYQRTVGDTIRRYEGSVARTFGDGILAFFGHPVAHEDDAERAIRAAHESIGAMQRANSARPGQPPLSVRIGIHTGPAVISRAAASDGTEVQAIGDTVNLAARLQGYAEADTTVVSDATLKLVQGMFVTRDLGEPELKGIQQKVQVHQVLAPTGAQTRLEAASKLTPFVGRRREIDLLDRCWRDARNGAGHAVLVSSEPGVGKSRLLRTLREQIESTAPWFECRCSPLARNTAFSPLLDLLNRSLQTPAGADNEIRVAALERSLTGSGSDPEESVPLLAPLLNMKLPARYAAAEYGAEQKHRRTLEALSRWCLGQSANGPVALVVEDLHWADPSTVEVLGSLIGKVAPRPMMVVPSARLEFRADWSGPRYSQLMLEPLGGEETTAIVDSITGHRPLPPAVLERLLRQAGGVPLFLEEATKALLESGQLVEQDGRLELVGRLDHLSIPATLQDTLSARLDRLGEAKPLIQLCAVIGRNVPYLLLRHAAEIDEALLQKRLEMLVAAQLLYPRGASPDVTYTFRHALIQDAAYASIWKKTRARLHGRVAQAIEAHLPQWAKAAPEMLALHWEGAGDARRAVSYRKAAGHLAARSSFKEATQHAQQALKLLATLPESEERVALELDVNLTLAAIVSAAGIVGTADPDAVYTRVRDLCARVKDPVLLGRALATSWVMHYQRCDFEATLDTGAQLLEIGRQTQRNGMQVVGWIARGLAHFGRGELREALATVRSAEQLTDDAKESAERRVAYDLVQPRLFIEAMTLAAMGQPDSALRVAQSAVARADALKHPFLMLFARSDALAAVQLLRGDWHEYREQSWPAEMRLVEQTGDQDHLWDARWHYAVATCVLGELDKGLPLYREAVDHERQWGAPLWHTFIHGQVADALLRAGRLDEAAAVLTEGFSIMEQHGERFWEADLWRVRGELMQAEGSPSADVQAAFDKALSVARNQAAALLELRAAVSFARFCLHEGRARTGRECLEPVCREFLEGAGLRDVKAADEVLAQLAAAG
jgi:predicted ATPase/class 3 adenylate cyclase